MNLVIVAGGLGSRLAPMTNYIPKFLVNIGKNTGYVEMIRYWQQYDLESITLIVHSRYKDLATAYHRMYFGEDKFGSPKFIVKTVDEANGSAHAILSTCDHLVGSKVLFTWCDVCPAEKIDYAGFRQFFGPNVIFTNYNSSNRYGVKLEKNSNSVLPVLDELGRGGCFGLYYISKFITDRVTFYPGQDFIEIMPQFGEIIEYELGSVIDFGDLPKLRHVQSKSDEAREFNSIEYVGDYVLKKATNAQGHSIIEKEANWYLSISRLAAENNVSIPKSIPRTWIADDKRSMFMSKVPGVPVWKVWNDLSDTDRLHVMKQVISESQSIFDLESYVMNREHVVDIDIFIEVDKKLTARFNEIKNVVSSFGDVRIVNGFELSCTNAYEIFKELNEEITSHYRVKPVYGFIHGDLQFSNSMVDLDTMKVSIIDPRGYFGNTVGSGLRDYDTAKLLYALSGYDQFNYSKNFGIEMLEDGEIKFTIPEVNLGGVQEFSDRYFKRIHYLWLAVCWLGLAQYIKNDPVKSVCAHYNGMRIANEYLYPDPSTRT